jgi:hypothetical protein
MIAEWFAETLQDALILYFAERLHIADEPTPQQAAQLEAATTRTRELFTSLAGGRTTYNKEVAQKLLNVMRLVDYAMLGDLGERLYSRLEVMTKKDSDLLDML